MPAREPQGVERVLMMMLYMSTVRNTYAEELHKDTEMGYEVSEKPGFIPMTLYKDAKDG